MAATTTGDQRGAITRLSPEWRRAWRWGGALWVASRVGMLTLTYFSILLASPTTVASAPDLVAAWQRWDANWYVDIARGGYAAPQSPAFFPLYPLLIAGLHAVVPWLSTFLCAVVLSNGALLIALVLLIRLTERELSARAAQNTALLLMAYPAAFFLTTAYTESIFLLWTLGTFLALRSGRWTIAGILAAAATLTRPTGGMLIFAFAYEYLRQSPLTWAQIRARGLRLARWRTSDGALRTLTGRLAAMAGMPIAVGLYAGYLWWRFGNPLLFKSVEGTYWNHRRALPTTGLLMAGRAMLDSALTTYTQARGLLDVVPILIFLTMLVLGIRRLPLSFTLYGLVVVLLGLTAPIPGPFPLQSGIRYMLPAFPAFMLLGAWSQRWPSVQTALLAIWFPLQGLLVYLFLHHQWII